MKKTRRIWNALPSLVLALALVFQTCATVHAAETGIDLTKNGSISVTLKDSNRPVPGCVFVLYRVAEISVENGNLAYRFTEEFKDCGAGLEDLNAEGLAEHLAAYAAVQKAEGSVKTTGSNGSVTFPDLALGLYLLVHEGRPTGYYSIAPFLVSIPLGGENGWLYDVDASPKVQPQPDQPGEEKLTVKKVWRGADAHRPGQITVHLLRDGEVFDTVVLGDENNWKYTWEGLDAGFRWNVVEAEVPEGYTVSYSHTGMTITITNTLPDSPEEPTTPKEPSLIQTGQLNWPIPILAGAGMLLMILGWLLMGEKRENSEKG